jgi:hypothetical protein
VTQAARRTRVRTQDDGAPPLDAPSLDPSAIERAYRRERYRRRVRVERRTEARRSHIRFWVTMLVLIFACAFIILASWHKVQTMFGV